LQEGVDAVEAVIVEDIAEVATLMSVAILAEMAPTSSLITEPLQTQLREITSAVKGM